MTLNGERGNYKTAKIYIVYIQIYTYIHILIRNNIIYAKITVV